MENQSELPSLYLWAEGNPPKWLNEEDNEIRHSIYVACRAKAKTARELLYETGLSQEQLDSILADSVEEGTLKKVAGDAYLTDFCVMPAQAFYDAECRINEIYENIGQEITDVLEEKKAAIWAHDFYGNQLPYSYLLWILYVFACDRFKHLADEKNRQIWQDKIPGDNGKNYRLAGTFMLPGEEIVQQEDPLNQVSWSRQLTYFESDKGRMVFVNCFDYPPFKDGERNGLVNAKNVPLLFKLIESGGEYRLSRDEAEHVAFLRHYGIIIKEEGLLKVNIPVITHECEAQIQRCLDDLLKPLVDKYFDSVTGAADTFIRPHIREDLLEEYINDVLSDLYNPQGYVLFWAMYIGETLDMVFDRSGAALYLKTIAG